MSRNVEKFVVRYILNILWYSEFEAACASMYMLFVGKILFELFDVAETLHTYLQCYFACPPILKRLESDTFWIFYGLWISALYVLFQGEILFWVFDASETLYTFS